ncbi:hypothetical protein P3S67_002378 [Capsicum chacoense]
MNFSKPKQTSPTSSSSSTPPHQNLQQTFKNLQTHFTNFLQTTMPQLNPLKTSQNSPPWAKIDVKKQPLSTETIEERLGGVPVYALSNASQEFVLVSGVKTGKVLGCFALVKLMLELFLNRWNLWTLQCETALGLFLLL